MKSQKGYVLVTKVASRQTVLGQWWNSAISHIGRWRKLHHQRIELGSLSDDALKDIGLSRADVYRETERPFWDDPMKH
ncbi:MAG TPA: DUF1127 domain-containing protein [Pseudomonas sp.]|nr:DUF1127 domain-containing protein [Pseudomonas sp.]